MRTDGTIAEKLCLSCGLCCNGVIFADVQLQPDDDALRLGELGLLKRSNSKKFPQPCAMHDGCRCSIYSDRPIYCRTFECLLLKGAQAGLINENDALRIIKDARKKAAHVRELLQRLGDNNDSLALSKRFQRMRKRIETQPAAAEDIQIFGLLTVAVHQLNVVLSERFYR